MTTTAYPVLSDAVRSLVIARAIVSTANRETQLQARKACRGVTRHALGIAKLSSAEVVAIEAICDAVRNNAGLYQMADEVTTPQGPAPAAFQRDFSPRVIIQVPPMVGTTTAPMLAVPMTSGNMSDANMSKVLEAVNRIEKMIEQLVVFLVAVCTKRGTEAFANAFTSPSVKAEVFTGIESRVTALPMARKASVGLVPYDNR